MTAPDLTLRMTEPVRDTLAMLLAKVLNLPEGAQVIDQLPVDPWGDLDAFRKQVFYPLYGDKDSQRSPDERSCQVTIPADDIVPIRDVIYDLAESFSGGHPWGPISQSERVAIQGLADRIEATRDARPLRFACPCCGFLTLSEPPPGTYAICKVCFWEDDGVQFADPDYEGGANTVSLNQARKTFALHGVSELRFEANVRAPLPEELP